MVLQINPVQPTVAWEALPADYVLPDDPVEDLQQPSLAAALTDALGANGLIQPDMLIASNFGLVATVNHKLLALPNCRENSSGMTLNRPLALCRLS